MYSEQQSHNLLMYKIGVGSWQVNLKTETISGHEAEVEGTLSVQPQAHPVKGFEEYFLNLTVKSNARNPWFVGEL